MFQVDRENNRLVRLKERRFADLGLRERDHLQEWLACQPDALGEELLIVQKEFAGFKDTRERLDLLALDKEGRLVVIENKLDDSGRDVVWQALKYVAYCSSLKKADIVEIYQQYLDRWDEDANAKQKLCDFLEVGELDDVVLNAGDDQRLVLVARDFRKEVTTTVLWLLGHGICAQCFRIVPYTLDEDTFINLEQIIPTPEEADYRIVMAAKEAGIKTDQSTMKRRQALRHAFWTQMLEYFRANDVSRYENISPSKEHWLSCATGMSGCSYNLVLLKERVRVELWLSRSDKEDNKWIFDELKRNEEKFNRRFGNTLQWSRLDEKKSSRIFYPHAFNGDDRDNWPEMIKWFCQHFVRFDRTFSKALAELGERVKTK